MCCGVGICGSQVRLGRGSHSVANVLGVPFAIVRTISDSADEHAAGAFPQFIQHVASVYSHGILRNYLCSQAED